MRNLLGDFRSGEADPDDDGGRICRSVDGDDKMDLSSVDKEGKPGLPSLPLFTAERFGDTEGDE